MNEHVAERITAAIGPEFVRSDVSGRVLVTPPNTEALSRILGLAYDDGWSAVVFGTGTWQSDDTPSQISISMRAIDQVPEFNRDEPSVVVPAGVPLDRLRRQAVAADLWLPLDPPGRPDRTVGSLLATATAGPLRHGFGPVRDQILGLTVVTGDGRILRSGEAAATPSVEVDPVKLHVGGFGGFGVITECRIRLQPIPGADTTWVAIGDRDRLTRVARNLAERGIPAAAVELISPALASEPDWVLAVRLLGADATAVQAVGATLAEGTEWPGWSELPPERSGLLWNGSARAITGAPVTLRLGVMAAGLDETLDLVIGRLGEGMLTASVLSGSLRWSGHSDIESLRALRSLLAAREIPLTLERAPWRIREAVGHFGAYREGMGGLVSRLRESYDPRNVLVTAVQVPERAA